MTRLSVKEAAAQKGCTAQAVRYAIRKGRVDAERVGKVHIVVSNAKWETWEPNPRIQEAVRNGWSQRAGFENQKPMKRAARKLR